MLRPALDRPAVRAVRAVSNATLGALTAASIVLHALGCAGSQSKPRQASDERSSSGGDLPMREPRSSAPGMAKLGALEPVAVPAQ
ncbi:MAG TPA: hypothetical protein VK509_19165, partial [Polyangiales bacterium]|nr:hypothetical protein [Polyangiales bacterium]